MEWNSILAFWTAVLGLVYILFALHELRGERPDPSIE